MSDRRFAAGVSRRQVWLWLGALSLAWWTGSLPIGSRDRDRILADAAGADGATERIVVSVAADGKPGDERPAEFHLRSDQFDGDRRIDPSSLEIHRVDPRTGRDLPESLPFRWYDEAIPYDFPECEQNVHATDGLALVFTKYPRWGEFYNLEGDGAAGRLVWLHRQEGSLASDYSIQFRWLEQGATPAAITPRGFVGDGSPRCRATGATSTGVIHSRIALADWNGDGLQDLLIGGSKGQVLFHANRGTPHEPRFGYGRLVTTNDGTPLDVGWSSAPLAVDWDGDGDLDLLSGCERNRVLFYRNEGTAAAPRLVNRGFVTADGKPVELPVKPVPKSPDGVYLLDYYPMLEAADWTGDGRLDLLAGGYITGRIFLYEGGDRNSDGTPQLAFRGPLQADGAPLNVGDWAASPCAADFDGDGDLDLISGNMAITAGGGDDTDPDHVLRYWENVGTATAPRLTQRAFPKSGVFPHVVLATPRAADLNGDGVLDLAVSANEYLYLFFNRGTRTSPRFEVHSEYLPAPWGSVPLPTWGLQFGDWDGDGRPDILSGLSIYRNLGQGEFEGLSLLPTGNVISHPAPRGDGWIYTQLADLNGDGRRDLLYGTHEGHIWLHPHRGGNPGTYAEPGVQLMLEGGTPLHVGPASGPATDFDVLQGSRTTMSAADFDADGRLDLVVGDTYGKTRYYRNTGTAREPLFAAPVMLGDLKIRMVPYASDWDRDGHPDVVGSAANGTVVVWRNLGDNRFAEPEPIKFPAVPYSPSVAVVDWNGDGDDDLIVATAYGYFCWFERSFLENGYARAVRK
ncbi:MAG: FG-GAP repeat domain-containing protein [Planctomycetales bacterium]